MVGETWSRKAFVRTLFPDLAHFFAKMCLDQQDLDENPTEKNLKYKKNEVGNLPRLTMPLILWVVNRVAYSTANQLEWSGYTIQRIATIIAQPIRINGRDRLIRTSWLRVVPWHYAVPRKISGATLSQLDFVRRREFTLTTVTIKICKEMSVRCESLHTSQSPNGAHRQVRLWIQYISVWTTSAVHAWSAAEPLHETEYLIALKDSFPWSPSRD